MVYPIIGTIVYILAFLVIIAVILRRNSPRKKLYVLVCSALCVLVYGGLCMIPYEGNIMEFDSAQSAFRYQHKGDIVRVIEGEQSCMVYYRDNLGIYSHSFFAKSGSKYQILPNRNCKQAAHVFRSGAALDVYTVSGSDDYYIVGTFGKRMNDAVLFDDQDNPTDVELLYDESNPDADFFTAYVKGWNSRYYFMVSDVKVGFEQR